MDSRSGQDGGDQFDSAAIASALQSIVSSDGFVRAPKTCRLLSYLVEQFLGNSDQPINAYAIAVDVLDRPESFDASSDSSVRVAVNRLRETLDRYYAAPPGSEQELRIRIPKGTYRPQIASNLDFSNSKSPKKAARFRPRKAAFGIVLAVIALGGLAIFSALRWFSPHDADAHIDTAVATLVVLPIQSSLEGGDLAYARGILRQLVHDIESTSFISVVDYSSADDVHLGSLGTAASHSLGMLVTSDEAALVFQLTDPEGSVIWANAFMPPSSDVEYATFLRVTTGAIATEVAGDHGVLVADFVQRLSVRIEEEADEPLEEYECLILAFAADASKIEEQLSAANSCLTTLVERGTDNASVLAQAAIMGFLDWSQGSSFDTEDATFLRALDLARQATQTDPLNALAWEHLGSILSARGSREDAIAAYEAGLSLTPWKPSLNFLLGWQLVLTGDWGAGMSRVRSGIEMTPNPPGYMLVPLALDSFRTGDFSDSLEVAREISVLGDRRGFILGYVAALANGDSTAANEIRAAADTVDGIDWNDPLGELARSFSNPDVIPEYELVIAATLRN